MQQTNPLSIFKRDLTRLLEISSIFLQHFVAFCLFFFFFKLNTSLVFYSNLARYSKCEQMKSHSKNISKSGVIRENEKKQQNAICDDDEKKMYQPKPERGQPHRHPTFKSRKKQNLAPNHLTMA